MRAELGIRRPVAEIDQRLLRLRRPGFRRAKARLETVTSGRRRDGDARDRAIVPEAKIRAGEAFVERLGEAAGFSGRKTGLLDDEAEILPQGSELLDRLLAPAGDEL